jgi:hypothetical protein
VLIKRTERQARHGSLAAALATHSGGHLDRRTFLRRSGLAAGALAAVGALPLTSVRKAEAAGSSPGTGATIRKNICTHCSVGCTVIAEVENGVWVGQEPGWDSPINRGSHCAKGAATREVVHGDRRLRYPMKLVNGQWNKISWDTAINEIGDKLMEIRAKSGSDSVYWLGSAKFTSEAAYQPQVCRVLGAIFPIASAHLIRPRRRRRQYLGLRRVDQQLHRHPQFQNTVLPRRQSREASGSLQHLRRQGTQPGEFHRRRPA